MERTYVEILLELQGNIESDCMMPAEEKAKILKKVSLLEEVLWKYSA